MLVGPLPALVDYRKMANQAGELTGSIPITAFTRFSEMLAENVGDVQLNIRFDLDDTHRVMVRGVVEVTGRLVCQSCLQTFAAPMGGELDFTIVSSEAALEDIEDDRDTVVFEDSKVSIVSLVEDDLILLVPMIPKHPEACPDSDYAIPAENRVVEEENSTTHRPFAGLAEAMKKQDKLES